MKKILSLVVILLMVAAVASAQTYGDSRIGAVRLTSKTIFNDSTDGYGHVHISTSPSSVYRVTLTSNSKNTSFFQLYDSAGSGMWTTEANYIASLESSKEGGSTVIKSCLGVGVGGVEYTKVITYDPPLRFDNGIFAGFGRGWGTGDSATIEYRQD